MGMKRKKYANGTGIAGYVENPADTMANYDIMIAKADQKAANNPFIPITMMAGQVLSSAISSGAFGATPTPGATPVAANGMNNAQGNIEAEKGEIIETPGGEAQELGGNKHESGGTNITVPPGTLIFSDRIKQDGKTMAERKKAREAKLKNLDKLLSHKDKAIVNTATRTKENLDREEAEDLRLQEIADSFANLTAQFAFGTSKEGVKKYDGGTGPGGIEYDVFGNPIVPGFAEGFGVNSDGYSSDPYSRAIPFKKDISGSAEPETPPNVEMLKSQEQPFVEPTGVLASMEAYYQNSLPKTDSKNMTIPTAGDITGLVGNVISSFGPMKNTLANRAGDTPNVNKFKDFGKEALQANADSMGYVASQKDNALKRINDKAVGSKRAGRNSARGVNTQRALDLAVDMGVNEADMGVNDAFANQMMQLLSQKSQLENTQDQVVMSGDQEVDLNNRKDRDNFYTQMGKDISTMGTGVQQTGKDINDIMKNPIYLNLLSQMGEYFTVDAKGNLIPKKQQTT